MSVPASVRSAKAYRQLQSKLGRKTTHRRAVRIGLVLANVVILGVIAFFVLQNPHSGTSSSTTLSAVSPVANPLDQVSSTDIAQTVAQINGLPETIAIANQAQSQAAETAIAASNDNVLAKPQVINTALKSRNDIQIYVTVGGDTVSTVAAKFGVTSDSIRWSNGIAGDGLAVGTRLKIPPVNGIIYTVKEGDTPDSLAVRFHSNRDQIIAYNDAEISGLKPGEQILIPNAVQLANAAASTGGAGFLWGTGPIYGFNGYDFGNCTWYVATQINVPSNWGNANTWAYYARLSGWNVNSSPSVGSIAQTSAGYFGHVAIVKSVNSNGTVTVTEMNVYGYDVVDTRTLPASEFQNYISR